MVGGVAYAFLWTRLIESLISLANMVLPKFPCSDRLRVVIHVNRVILTFLLNLNPGGLFLIWFVWNVNYEEELGLDVDVVTLKQDAVVRTH